LERTKAAFRRHDADYDHPGATRMWFKKFKGRRLDELDQLDPAYRSTLLKPVPHRFRHLLGLVCHQISVLDHDNSANCSQFEVFKLINDRFNEKVEEERNAALPTGSGKGLDGLEDAENTVEAKETYQMEVRSRARSSRPAPNIIHPMGELLGPRDNLSPPPDESNKDSPSADHRHGKDIHTTMTNFSTPKVNSYFQHAKSTLDQMPQIDLPPPHPDENIIKHANTQQNTRQELFSSWASDAPKEVVEASRKRKYDSMMSLSSSASRHMRNSPIVLAGTRTKRRKSTKQPSPMPRKGTKRQPLAELSSKNRQPASYLEQGSSGTIVVQTKSDENIVANSCSKYKKKLTQAPKEVKDLVKW